MAFHAHAFLIVRWPFLICIKCLAVRTPAGGSSARFILRGVTGQCYIASVQCQFDYLLFMKRKSVWKIILDAHAIFWMAVATWNLVCHLFFCHVHLVIWMSTSVSMTRSAVDTLKLVFLEGYNTFALRHDIEWFCHSAGIFKAFTRKWRLVSRFENYWFTSVLELAVFCNISSSSEKWSSTSRQYQLWDKEWM